MSCARSYFKTKVLDGGLATELEAIGFECVNHPLFTSMLIKDNPMAIKKAHKRCLLAGSDAVITASYQASIDGFVKNFEVSKEEAARIIQSSVDIAKDAVNEVLSSHSKHEELYVAASVGPYGATLHDMSEYNGRYVDNMTIEKLKEWHRERIALLLSRNPDYLAIETMPALKEVVAILELLKEFPDAKAWDAKTTFHKDDFVQSVETVSQYSQVKSIGVNCSEVVHVEELIRLARNVIKTQQSIICYPNDGLNFMGERFHRGSEFHDLSQYTSKWLHVGNVEWIGGCCGVTSKDISQISEVVCQWNAKNDSLL